MELVNPLDHPAWDAWVGKFPEAQFFHGSGWGRVLRETYGHRPVYPAVLKGDKLEGVLPLMEVASPLTGRRGVSLPFTDFCAPLRGAGVEGREFFEAAMAEGRRAGWRYLECRGGQEDWGGSSACVSYWGHSIDLTGGAPQLFEGLDGAIRRGVRKAEKSGLKVEFGVDSGLMDVYYGLHGETRRRHGLPPQPLLLFKNIQRGMLAAGFGEVGLVRREGRAIAGAVYLWFGRRAIYKYGASDYKEQEHRPNNLLMWRAMERLAGRGFERLHLGRTSLMHEGLRRFKLGFGAEENMIESCKYDFGRGAFVKETDNVEGWHNEIFGRMPLFVLKLVGKLLYPHLS